MTDGALRLGRLELRAGFIVVAAAGMLFAPGGLIVTFLAAAVLHELGHIAVLYALGGRVERVRVSAIGAEIVCRKERLSYKRELAVYLAGPIASAAVGVVCAFAARALASDPLYIFAGANVLLGAFNLLPCRGLDGGGALRIASLMAFDREVAALDWLHYAVGAALMILGLWAAANGGFNLALVWIAVWILIGRKDY